MRVDIFDLLTSASQGYRWHGFEEGKLTADSADRSCQNRWDLLLSS
jgi:hypothetical protein